MTLIRNVTTASFLMSLVACGGGGGGSSDGGGSSEDFDSAELEQFAGTYEGTITATVNLQNGSETLSREIRFVVSDDGRTISVDNESFDLDSNVFQVTVPLPLSNSTTTCILDTTISGTITVDLISSTVSGSGDCLVQGEGVVVGELSGYLGASRI